MHKTALERRVLGGYVPFFKAVLTGGALVVLWPPAISSRELPAILRDGEGASLRRRMRHTEAGGLGAQRAIKW